MANTSDSTASLPPSAPTPLSSTTKENLTPVACKIEELNESRSELLGRIQGLKKDLQTWRSKLDTQVKVYRDELSELKQSLNTEVEQLRSEFQELRTTLQQQQDDVTSSLRSIGLQDAKGDLSSPKTEVENMKGDSKADILTPEDYGSDHSDVSTLEDGVKAES